MAHAALTQTSIRVTPAKVTMLVGEAHEFKAVDSQGHSPANVTWTVSNPAIAQFLPAGHPQIIAHRPGRLTVTVHSNHGFADAQVEVIEGTTMPVGTIKWSAGDFPGCDGGGPHSAGVFAQWRGCF